MIKSLTSQPKLHQLCGKIMAEDKDKQLITGIFHHRTLIERTFLPISNIRRFLSASYAILQMEVLREIRITGWFFYPVILLNSGPAATVYACGGRSEKHYQPWKDSSLQLLQAFSRLSGIRISASLFPSSMARLA